MSKLLSFGMLTAETAALKQTLVPLKHAQLKKGEPERTKTMQQTAAITTPAAVAGQNTVLNNCKI